MKKIIKKIIKIVVPRKLLNRVISFRSNISPLKRSNGWSTFEALTKGHIVYPYTKVSADKSFARQFSYILSKIDVARPNSYYYPFDPRFIRAIYPGTFIIASITADFGEILTTNCASLKRRINNTRNKNFANTELSIVASIESLILRIANDETSDNREKTLQTYLTNIINGAPASFDEALQKILFFDALLWQAGHLHIGLGRLDMILFPYYKQDVDRGLISREDAKKMLTDFCSTLGYQTPAKSASIIGDTGQYILLGGVDSHGVNIENEITNLFLEIFTEKHFPDPKLIYRVNANTPDEKWLKAIKCISTGTGSPLIMNETLIMDRMVKFGYAKEDVWNLGTSACWEPLIIGKSFDQNNPLPSVNLINPLSEILIGEDCPKDFDGLLARYKDKLKEDILFTAKDIKFDCSPLFTLLMDKNIESEKDFTAGGAKYNFHGMQAVGLPNLINALINIKQKIFDDRTISLESLRAALAANFKGYEDIRKILLAGDRKFGKNNPDIIDLTNDVMDFVAATAEKVSINGNKVKIGFSSPAYIVTDNSLPSADGRKSGEPVAVHISPTSSSIDIAEVLDFASNLKYTGNRLNGNVVDFILPSSYINYPDKLAALLKNAINHGIFELQLNVLDRDTLVDAKAHPEKYPNLIVRVWGFSAYFNDLPEEYKDNLINRATVYEGA